MSDAVGLCRFPDGAIFWFEYNGTSDLCRPALFTTREELHRRWREAGLYPSCTCGGEHEAVELYNDYGCGDCWMGEACRHCMCITAGFEQYDSYGDAEAEPVPDWSWAERLLMGARR